LHFRFAATVHYSEAADRTAIVVGVTDLTPKAGLPNLAIEQDLLDPTLLFFEGSLKEDSGLLVGVQGIEFKANRVLRGKRGA
jgi:hypothetical protein